MKQAIVIAAFCAVAASGRASTLAASDVRSLYSDLFAVSVSDSRSGKDVFAVVRDLPADHPLSVLTRDHERLLMFLLTNYSDIDFERLRRSSAQDASQYLTASIRKSDRLASVMLPLVVAVLQERGDKVEGIRPPAARSIPLSDLTRIAARFFYVDEITPEGRARARICVGINGLRDAPFPRDPLLEAIAYSAIMRDWETDRRVMPDFTRTLRQLRQTSPPSDGDAALSRARVAMWSEMNKSAPLADILKKEVARTSHFAKVSLRQ
jgi:hypothetical protein